MPRNLTPDERDRARQERTGRQLAALAGVPRRFNRPVRMSMDPNGKPDDYSGTDDDTSLMTDVSEALSQFGLAVEPCDSYEEFLQHILTAANSAGESQRDDPVKLARPEPEVVSMSMSPADRARQEAGADELIALCGVSKRR